MLYIFNVLRGGGILWVSESKEIRLSMVCVFNKQLYLVCKQTNYCIPGSRVSATGSVCPTLPDSYIQMATF